MHANQSEHVPGPQPGPPHNKPTPPPQPRGGINGKSLSLALQSTSIILSLGGVVFSFFMYFNSQRVLQLAQGEAQVQLAKKTAAEAKYAELINQLEAKLKELHGGLTSAQTDVAKADLRRTLAEAGLTGIDYDWAEAFMSNPAVLGLRTRFLKEVVEPAVACLSLDPGETTEAFTVRCKGKDIATLLSQNFPGLSFSNLLGPQPIIPRGEQNASRPPLDINRERTSGRIFK